MSAASPEQVAQLFAQIVANPEDDHPRLVYADALIQQGVVHGELITLQVSRAAGRGTPAQADRERVLMGSLDAVAAPLLGACKHVVFERGFPVSVHLDNNSVVQDTPAWGTVRELTSPPSRHCDALHSLFACGRLANVISVRRLAAASIDALASHGATWRDMEISTDVPVRKLSRFPALRRLHVVSLNGLNEDLFVGAPPLHSLTLWTPGFELSPSLLNAFPTLRHLAITHGQLTFALEGHTFPIESLAIPFELDEGLEPWLRAMPRVRTLQVHDQRLLARSRLFIPQQLARVLALPQLEQLTFHNYATSRIARFERDGRGWTLVFPCAERGDDFYAMICERAAALIPLGIKRVILEPSQPRHESTPFHDLRDLELADIARAWAPVPVETRDVFRWPDRTPDEAGRSERRCSVR